MFASENERHAWVRFASGAASCVAGDEEDAVTDAACAAAFADALLLECRARVSVGRRRGGEEE